MKMLYGFLPIGTLCFIYSNSALATPSPVKLNPCEGRGFPATAISGMGKAAEGLGDGEGEWADISAGLGFAIWALNFAAVEAAVSAEAENECKKELTTELVDKLGECANLCSQHNCSYKIRTSDHSACEATCTTSSVGPGGTFFGTPTLLECTAAGSMNVECTCTS